jgi:hypothetical protein
MQARERRTDPEEPMAGSGDGVVNTPEETRLSWRRLDWAHLINVIGAIAAIGTLGATAYATYYGAEVAREQLQQSQEDAEQNSRAQATRVSFWVSSGDTGDGSVHLMNRSPDPVHDVLIGYADVRMPNSASFVTRVGYLAPCSELTYEHGALGYNKAVFDGPTGAEWETTLKIRGVSFFDRDGTGWTRQERVLKKGTTTFGSERVIPNEAPTEKPVPSCGSQD